jgi:L-histidine N-alpha-methyltransferase
MSDDQTTPRFSVEVHVGPDDVRAALERDVRAGLTAESKWLPPVWFYDEEGSRLFDEITRLPEYYPTRAEREILQGHAAAIARQARPDTLVELGSGTSEKTRILLDALVAEGSLQRFVPFDVSEQILVEAAAAIAQERPTLTVHAIAGDFHRHLGRIPQGGRRLVAFLGGTIGNLMPDERARFLGQLSSTFGPDDRLLLGTDLVKSRDRLVAAYDDSQGVTAAFNRNVLKVLNNELGGDFDPQRFRHRAVWNEVDEWIEMRLQSTVDQSVYLKALDLDLHFGAGEELRTEISAKFTRERLAGDLGRGGFVSEMAWTDAAGDFLLTLARPAG